MALEEGSLGNSSASSSEQSGQPQHQLLMSSSSTPQLPNLPSIIEDSNSNSDDFQQNKTSVLSAHASRAAAAHGAAPGEGEEAEDDNVSWGIPMTIQSPSGRDKEKDASSSDPPAQEGPTRATGTISSSPSKKKKRKQKEDKEKGHKEEEEGKAAAVDAPLSSLSGVSSSLGMPPAGSASEIPHLPPISLRNRLTGFFSRKN
jgi:hypothetical protein